nr:transposase (putative), gypsy type [Tanacetum cinerariifolium]
MGRDTIQLENAVSTISQEYLLEFTSEYGIPDSLYPELPGPEDSIVEFLEGKVGVYTKFFEFANFRIPISQFLFDILGHYQIHLSQLSVIGAAKFSHFEINCHILNIIPTLNLFRVFYIPSFNVGWMSSSKRPGKNTPQCYTKPLDSLKNWNNLFFWVDDRVFPTIADWRTSAPKDQMPPFDSYFAADVTSLNTRRTSIQKQPKALLCLVGLSRRYFLGDDVYLTFLYDDDRDMDLFSLISAPNPAKMKTRTRPRATHEVPLSTATANRVIDMEDMTGASGSSGTSSTSTLGEKSLASMRIGTGTTVFALKTQEILVHTEGVSDPDPLSFSRKAVVTKDSNSEKSISFNSMVGSPGSICQPGWGVTNNCRLDTPATWQDMVDHIVPPGYFSELRHLPNAEFLNQYNTTLARQVAMGSQLRLQFEQETKLLKKAVAQGAVEAKNVELAVELAKDLIMGEERIKAAFEEFKKYEDDRVSSRCAEMNARLDALSIDFDEELYLHMLTAIASRRWIIGHDLRLAVIKCTESTELRQVFADVVYARIAKGMSEGLKHEVEHGKAKVDLAAIKAYEPEADTKYVAAFHALKDLKYPLVDQLEKLKDAPIDVIMSSLFFESDSGEDTPQWIRELHPSSSQLKILVYPEVRNPKDPWSFKDEILLEDAIAANVSRAEKKKKCQVVCRTHRVSFAHHARSDGVPVSVPTVAPQGLSILLADAATQTEIIEDEASSRLIRSKSLLPLYNLDWP